MANAKALEDKLSREQLNELATSKGIENPEGFANKGVLAEKLEAEGVTDEELDALTVTEEDDAPEGDSNLPASDPKSVAANEEAAGDNPTVTPSTADDLNSLHEPGSVRDGSIANENLDPTDEKHPDINANPGGRQKTAGNGETLNDASRNHESVEEAAKVGQETAERNGEEESNLSDAATESGTSRKSSTIEDQVAEGVKTAKRNAAAEKKQAKADGTLSPYL